MDSNTCPAPSDGRRAAFWVIVAGMVVVGAIQARFLRQAWQQNKLTEERYTHAVAGSQQGLFSWAIPSATDEWLDSTFWTGPNFYSVLQSADDKWAPTFRNVLRHIHPDDRERYQEALTQAIKTDGVFDIDCQARSGNDTYIWVACHGEVSEIDGVRTLSGSIMNITDRMEERLRSDMILNSATVAIIMCSPDRRITVFNDAASRMFGWSREEMQGNSTDRLVTDDYLAHHVEVMKRATARLADAEGDVSVSRVGVAGEAKNQAGEVFPITLDLHGIKYRGKIEFIAVIRDGTPAVQMQLNEGAKPMAAPQVINTRAR